MSAPTEPGWYWAVRKITGTRLHVVDGPWIVVHWNGTLATVPGEEGGWLASGFERWGPRIPEPAEHYGWRDPLLSSMYRFAVESLRALGRVGVSRAAAINLVHGSLSGVNMATGTDLDAILDDAQREAWDLGEPGVPFFCTCDEMPEGQKCPACEDPERWRAEWGPESSDKPDP